MSSSSLAATTLSRSSDAPATGVDRIRMLIGTGPLERSPSARYGPRESDVLLRLRVSTMTPAIVPFNRRRKYPVHPGTTASGPALRGPCSSSMLRPASGPSCRNRANGGVSRRMRPQLRTGRSVSPEDGTRTGRPGAVPCHGWDRDALVEPRPPPSPTHRETPAGAGWMALDYGRNLGAAGGSWPGVGRADAEIISGRVGSTKGR